MRRYVEPDDLYSATRFRRFSSPTAGNTTSARLVGPGEGGLGDLKQQVLLTLYPLERVDQFLGDLPVGAGPIRCTVEISRSTSASVISRRRQYSNAASNAIRSSTGWSRV